jgi:hypothetical protein
VRARLAIVIAVGTLALTLVAGALAAAPDLRSPQEGASFVSGDRITFVAAITSNASPAQLNFYVTRDPSQVNSNGVFFPFVDAMQGVSTGEPGVFTAGPDSDDAWPAKPGTYWWQAVQGCIVTSDPGCVNASPARSFTINARPASTVARGTEPNTFLTHHPRHRTHKRKVAFAFSSDVAGAHFRCLYAEGWSHCRSPHTFRHLKPGRYKFKARAVVNGVQDPTPASWRFKVLR